jgi:hypothetical protein
MKNKNKKKTRKQLDNKQNNKDRDEWRLWFY